MERTQINDGTLTTPGSANDQPIFPANANRKMLYVGTTAQSLFVKIGGKNVGFVVPTFGNGMWWHEYDLGQAIGGEVAINDQGGPTTAVIYEVIRIPGS